MMQQPHEPQVRAGGSYRPPPQMQYVHAPMMQMPQVPLNLPYGAVPMHMPMQLPPGAMPMHLPMHHPGMPVGPIIPGTPSASTRNAETVPQVYRQISMPAQPLQPTMQPNAMSETVPTLPPYFMQQPGSLPYPQAMPLQHPILGPQKDELGRSQIACAPPMFVSGSQNGIIQERVSLAPPVVHAVSSELPKSVTPEFTAVTTHSESADQCEQPPVNERERVLQSMVQNAKAEQEKMFTVQYTTKRFEPAPQPSTLNTPNKESEMELDREIELAADRFLDEVENSATKIPKAMNRRVSAAKPAAPRPPTRRGLTKPVTKPNDVPSPAVKEKYFTTANRFKPPPRVAPQTTPTKAGVAFGRTLGTPTSTTRRARISSDATSERKAKTPVVRRISKVPDPLKDVEDDGRTEAVQHLTASFQMSSPADRENLSKWSQMRELITMSASAMRRRELAEFRAITKNPDMCVKIVMEACLCLLGHDSKDWQSVRRLLQREDRFLADCRALQPERVTSLQLKKLRRLLAKTELSDATLQVSAPSFIPFATWCRAMCCYIEMTRHADKLALGNKFTKEPNIDMLAEWEARGDGRRLSYLEFSPDIRGLSWDQKACVENLTVWRRDVAEVTWPGITDCRNIDFDEMVHMDIGEVLVYPDSRMRPAEGRELNKHCVVKVFQCWPRSVADPKQMSQEDADRYYRRIEHMTQSKEGQMIEYDILWGHWFFEVATWNRD